MVNYASVSCGISSPEQSVKFVSKRLDISMFKLVLNIPCATWFVTSAVTVFQLHMAKTSVDDKILNENLFDGESILINKF